MFGLHVTETLPSAANLSSTVTVSVLIPLCWELGHCATSVPLHLFQAAYIKGCSLASKLGSAEPEVRGAGQAALPYIGKRPRELF